MSETTYDFDKRLQKLGKKHARIKANGFVRKLGKDGLITIHARRRGPTFPLRGLIAVFVVAFVFKGFLLASMGEADYAERVAALQSGTMVEKAGAWVMQVDPATHGMASFLQPFLN